MLEEWQNGARIRGLDGWTFQVSLERRLSVASVLSHLMASFHRSKLYLTTMDYTII